MTTDVYIGRLRALYTDVVTEKERLITALSKLDRQVSAIYHEIEKCDIDSNNGYGAALLLQNTLRQRRVVKDALLHLKPVYDMLHANMGSVEKQHHKVVAKSEEVRRSLNVTLTIHDIDLEGP